MRKMFSEKQIKGLAVSGVNAGIESGDVQVGTKLYKHSISFTTGDEIIITSSLSAECSSVNDIQNTFQMLYSGLCISSAEGNGIIINLYSDGSDLYLTYFDDETQAPTDLLLNDSQIESDSVSPL